MARSLTVRLPDDVADAAETTARVHGTRINQLIIDAPRVEIERVRTDAYFQTQARRLLERDRAIPDTLTESRSSATGIRRRLRT